MARFDLVPLLKHISPDENYQTWTQIGMALKHEGYPCSVWEDWSRGGAKYHEGECARKWATFNEEACGIVTGATITQLAKDRGWKATDGRLDPFNMTFTDADLIPYVDMDDVETEDFVIPSLDEWKPDQDVINYLNALFRPDERVGLAFDSFQDEDGKWKPRQGGKQWTVAELIARLKKYKGSVVMALGSLSNEAAGGWVNINPLDGDGTKNINVTAFRYTLIESDSMELSQQIAFIKSIELPCAAIVYSGGKSVHAIVHVDADTIQEYRERVSKLYEVCNKNGFKIDTQNKNPARLTRMPGVTRNGVPQFLIDTKCGKASWDEWVAYLDEVNDNLPPFEQLQEVLKSPPPLKPVVIDGVLRKGHKMLLTGPSKAGKSFLQVQLAIAIAAGRTWLKWPCKKGKVLYCNLEIDPASLAHRFEDTYEVLGEEIRKAADDNITLWNLRGSVTPLVKFAPILMRRLKAREFSVIIVDPIYKIMQGDENSAKDITDFGNWLDKIARETGCAVIYCHHHSKGAQGMKRSADRGSGSGVFARDADALIDLTPLELTEDQEAEDAAPAYCVSGTLREFPSFPDFAVRFRHPIHELDELLDPKKTEGSLEGNRIKGNQTQTANKNSRIDEFREKLEEHLRRGDKVTQADMADEIGVSVNTIRAYIKTVNGDEPMYMVENGRGGCIKWADTIFM